jgi:A/G-specific adenine glycosylase
VYPLLVSEIMLQQTQVERVIPFYQSFMKQFPTAKKLAKSPLSRVLKAWQGLGYNRRAKMLHMAAAELLTRDIQSVSDLETLPGVGPYTARAVAAFAFNQETIVIETNIRTVIIHHFFSGKHKVSDREIGDVLGTLLPKGRAREWYSALMDYGAHLKHSGISHTVRSTTHVKQSKFTGSLREARGAIVKKLAQDGPTSSTDLSNLLGSSRRTQMRGALRALCLEKLIQKDIKNYRLPGE